jgi:hypothetical protein
MSDLLSVQQAAARCGVAERTVRRWITSGRLQSDTGPRGALIAPGNLEPFLRRVGHVHEKVRTATAAETDSPDAVPGGPDATSDMSEALRLIEKLQQQNMELAGRVGYYQAQLDQARDTIKMLEAPRAEAPVISSKREEKDSAEPERRSLWQRLRRWWFDTPTTIPDNIITPLDKK